MEGRGVGGVAFILLAAIALLAPSAAAVVTVYTDLPSFDVATAANVEIDFEDLNSVSLQGVTFRNPFTLEAGFCSAPTCPPDPRNPQGGNIVLALSVGGDVTFPDGVTAVTLTVEGIGDAWFSLRVTNGGGASFTVDGQGVPFGAETVDVDSLAGVRKIQVAATSGGPVAFAAVIARDGGGAPLADVDFEGMTPDAPCVLSDCTPSRDGQPVVPNPLALHGAVFADPHALTEAFCAAPTCQVDPDNPVGNVELLLSPNASITFPEPRYGVLIVVEGIGDNPFTVRATDGAGDAVVASGRGVPFGVAYLGFTSEHGIARIDAIAVGGTGGPLAVSAVLLASAPGSPTSGPAAPHVRPVREVKPEVTPSPSVPAVIPPSGPPPVVPNALGATGASSTPMAGVMLAASAGIALALAAWRRRRRR